MNLRERFAPLERSPLVTWIDQCEPVRLVWANRAAVALFQAPSLEALMARDFSDMSEATRIQRRGWMEAFRGGEAECFEQEWVLYPAGVPTPLNLYISPVELEGGVPGFLFQGVRKAVATAPDIIRNAEAMRHTSAAVVMLSAAGEIVHRNPSAARAFGRDSSFSSWFGDELRAEILGVSGPDEIFRGRARTDYGGAPRDLAIEARMTLDPVSGDDVVLLHILDETARYGAEREAAEKGRLIEELEGALKLVEEQKQRWRALVDSAPDLVMIVDRVHRIEFANRGLEGGAGGESPRLVGEKVEALFEAEAGAQLWTVIEEVFETGSQGTHEGRARPERGGRRHSLRLGPIDSGGAIERLTLIASDVTAARELEEQLRHSQKMQAVGTLAGGVAHDFNNLLTVIGGASDLLELDLDLEDGHPAQPLLEDIRGAVERATGLTRRLLVFSRRQVVQPKIVDLSQLVTDISKLLVRVLGEDIALRLALSERECWVCVDPGQLEQVIMNLALNARDAMDGRGELQIRSGHLEPPERGVLVQVSDTGAGMSPEVQARIFEPFFTTKEPGKGTGLGLSMVHSIVESHGGKLVVESTLGRGTTIAVELPEPNAEAVASAPVRARARADSPGLPRGRETVLLVEDESEVRRLVARMLEELGYTVLVASTPAEGLELGRGHAPIDLLVSDVMLPQMSGPRLRDIVVELHPDIAVLFISGYTDGELREEDAFLAKPFTQAQLALALRAVVEERPGLEA